MRLTSSLSRPRRTNLQNPVQLVRRRSSFHPAKSKRWIRRRKRKSPIWISRLLAVENAEPWCHLADPSSNRRQARICRRMSLTKIRRPTQHPLFRVLLRRPIKRNRNQGRSRGRFPSHPTKPGLPTSSRKVLMTKSLPMSLLRMMDMMTMRGAMMISRPLAVKSDRQR